MNFKIWTNANLAPEAMDLLREGIGDHELVQAGEKTTNLGGGTASESLIEATVAFGQPDPVQMIELPLLRWTHLTSAGYTRYDRGDLRTALTDRGALLTNSSSVFDEPCAQHLLAFMLASRVSCPNRCAANGVRAIGAMVAFDL
ncbi:MAG: hypothetical protein ACOYON_06220 [Fimbriimonas sp.]